MALRTETSEIDCLGLFATLFAKNINIYVEQGSYWEADSVSVSHDVPHTVRPEDPSTCSHPWLGSRSRSEVARPDVPRVFLKLLTALSIIACFFGKWQKLKPTKYTLFRLKNPFCLQLVCYMFRHSRLSVITYVQREVYKTLTQYITTDNVFV